MLNILLCLFLFQKSWVGIGVLCGIFVASALLRSSVP
jgi:hypothetical protein